MTTRARWMATLVSMRARGFSLVEVTVAATLLAAGILGLVGSHRAMQRLDQLGRRTAEAAEAAAGRLGLLRATGCGGASTGSVTGPIAEQWSTTVAGTRQSATVSISFEHDARPRNIRYDITWYCGPVP